MSLHCFNQIQTGGQKTQCQVKWYQVQWSARLPDKHKIHDRTSGLSKVIQTHDLRELEKREHLITRSPIHYYCTSFRCLSLTAWEILFCTGSLLPLVWSQVYAAPRLPKLPTSSDSTTDRMLASALSFSDSPLAPATSSSCAQPLPLECIALPISRRCFPIHHCTEWNNKVWAT